MPNPHDYPGGYEHQRKDCEHHDRIHNSVQQQAKSEPEQGQRLEQSWRNQARCRQSAGDTKRHQKYRGTIAPQQRNNHRHGGKHQPGRTRRWRLNLARSIAFVEIPVQLRTPVPEAPTILAYCAG
jgi:hypothetical protein